jgi:hypothetical protein
MRILHTIVTRDGCLVVTADSLVCSRNVCVQDAQAAPAQ